VSGRMQRPLPELRCWPERDQLRVRREPDRFALGEAEGFAVL